MERQAWADRVMVLVLERGLTLAEVSRRMGRGPRALYTVLQAANPRLSTLNKLAEVLDLPTWMLLYDD
jgi:predicted transcriptional regulator